MFQRTLRISEALAKKLVDGGFTTLEEIAYVPFTELREASGLWDEEATALRDRARSLLLVELSEDPRRGLPDA